MDLSFDAIQEEIAGFDLSLIADLSFNCVIVEVQVMSTSEPYRGGTQSHFSNRKAFLRPIY